MAQEPFKELSHLSCDGDVAEMMNGFHQNATPFGIIPLPFARFT